LLLPPTLILLLYYNDCCYCTGKVFAGIVAVATAAAAEAAVGEANRVPVDTILAPL
jgi:hypothetical protein